ncbi:uncharacterized protein LOC115438994 [Sphaeramia orbicularis]|uniref:uncharacterized protein LOC115438994 n=1 Tax=Sphaeramia orbicularis TaxID=375764 RepID=UPI00117FCF07|nr:uncharacterized protein LOC115438994 [Sphaeramia orbicularis]
MHFLIQRLYTSEIKGRKRNCVQKDDDQHQNNMKNPSVLLGVCVLLLSGLNVSSVSVDIYPNLQQFFSRQDSFSVSCADVQTDGWTVKRRQTDGNTQTCGDGEGTFGRIDESFCVINFPLSSSSGVYWCETSSGQQSEQVSITVTDGDVILDIPALPVETGSDVTLRCRVRGGSTVEPKLLKNLQTVPSVEEWTISVDHHVWCRPVLLFCSTDWYISTEQPEGQSFHYH